MVDGEVEERKGGGLLVIEHGEQYELQSLCSKNSSMVASLSNVACLWSGESLLFHDGDGKGDGIALSIPIMPS